MTRASVQSFADLPQLDITETSIGPDGQRSVHLGKLSTAGLAASIKNLLGSCTVLTIGNDWWRAATEMKKQGLAPTQERAPRQEAAPKQEPAPKDMPADK